MIRLKLAWILVLSLIFVPFMCVHGEPTSGDIAKAVASMRGVDPYGLTKEQQKAKAAELGEAWKVIAGAGPKGVTALNDELRRIDDKKEKDDHFKLGSAALLWHIARAEEAPAIAAIWSGNIDLNASDNYVFFTAFYAARTQDPRVLPMLTAILRDDKGKVFIPQHSLAIGPRLFQEFIWGAFGPKGLPTLERVLYDSRDERAIASAIYLLGKAQDRDAMVKIREIAYTGKGMARTAAIGALGEFGHPQDFDFLLSGLKNSKGEETFDFASALYEYGDLRAVPHLIPLLSTEDNVLGTEVIASLTHLLTPEGITALRRYCENPGSAKHRAPCTQITKGLSARNGSGDVSDAQIAAKLRERAADKYRLKPSDRSLSHDELLRAADEWKTNRRISGGTYSWVEDRHVMAAATAADLPLLLDVTAALYTRLSDECLYEVRIMRQLIQRLGRSRYRKDVGVCEKVEPL